MDSSPIILDIRDSTPEFYQVSFNDSSGFPFDDTTQRPNIRSYFDDISTRHPEFADSFLGSDWDDDFPRFGRKRRVSSSRGEQQEPQQSSQASGSSQEPQTSQQPTTEQNLQKKNGLRNTVPNVPTAAGLSEEERRPRSMSAPPDNRQDLPKRFVSKCEIPIVHDPSEPATQQEPQQHPTASQQKPPMAPKNQDQQGNVRVIPIMVEGRDEPVINRDMETPTFEARLPRDFGNYQNHSPRFSNAGPQTPSPQPNQQQQQYPQPPPQQQHHQQQYPQPPPQQQYAQPPTQQQHHMPQQEHKRSESPRPSKQPEPADAISKVQLVQQEVENIQKEVEKFTGNLRTDKHYMYLDEMLTRNLIKLDDIETEGKDNIRQLRKDTIKNINRCISMLESKVPKDDEQQPMDVDKTKDSSSVNAESSSEQKMEVESQAESQPSQG